MEDPQEDPLAVHCFCVYSGNVLLGDLGISRSRERDLLSALSIYPRFVGFINTPILDVFIVYRRILCLCFILLYFDACSLLWFWPHLFCGAGHKKRREEQLKWSLAFRLYIGSFPCAQLPGPVHTARLGRVCFLIFSLGLYFVYLVILL